MFTKVQHALWLPSNSLFYGLNKPLASICNFISEHTQKDSNSRLYENGTTTFLVLLLDNIFLKANTFPFLSFTASACCLLSIQQDSSCQLGIKSSFVMISPQPTKNLYWSAFLLRIFDLSKNRTFQVSIFLSHQLFFLIPFLRCCFNIKVFIKAIFGFKNFGFEVFAFKVFAFKVYAFEVFAFEVFIFEVMAFEIFVFEVFWSKVFIFVVLEKLECCF